MIHILTLGAGRSSVSLLDYLKNYAQDKDVTLHVADTNLEAAKKTVGSHPKVEFHVLDASHPESRIQLIERANLVISMLPAYMHPDVARDCLAYEKNLITPSYIGSEMQSFHDEAKSKGLSFINELGVDPGIDHMSAMRILDGLRQEGAEITCFESFTGGLVAPESDDNPWNYKFTWNPRNVVLAGQGGAVKFKHNGLFKYIPYQKLFRRSEVIEIPGYGRFEGYANRDSLNYRELYGLMGVPTIYRGTLRRVGYCRAWNIFVQMGMTDDSFVMEGSKNMTHRDFTNSFLAYNPSDSVELKLMHYMKLDQDSEIIDKLKWIGIFDDEPVGLDQDGTPAQILQKILEKKWTLKPDDKDMIVMWHKIRAKMPDREEELELHSSMVVIGDDQLRTAMAKTVGLPVGIAAKNLLEGKIERKGVFAPMYRDIYEPVLNELEAFEIGFQEREIPLSEQQPS